MQVASKELCEQLYEVSKWETPEYENGFGTDLGYPAYTLGFLIRKLPPRQDPDFGDEVMYYPGVHMIGEVIHETHAIAGYWDIEGELWGDWSEVGDTPENALCRLALELFKANILKPDGRA